MGYLNVNDIAKKFIDWRNGQGRLVSWTSFHENKINDIRRDFENGKIQREEVAGRLIGAFDSLKIYLDSSEKRELEKMIKYY